MSRTPPPAAPLPAPEGRAPELTYHADGTPVRTLAEMLRIRAAATPDATAIIKADRTTTFREQDERSSQVANALLRDGVGVGDRVAFIGGNSPEFLQVLFGAAKVGAIATAVNTRLAVPEVQHILADADPTVVVLGRDEGHLLPATEGLTGLARVVHMGAPDDSSWDAWLDGTSTADPGRVADPDETCVIFYTSGTTGLPKGIELTGDNLGRALATMHLEMELDGDGVASAPVPFFHIAGFGLAIVVLVNGAALLLDQPTSPTHLLELLQRHRVTHAVMVPTLLQTIVNMPESKEVDWSHLRFVIYGAMPIPLPVLQRSSELIGCRFIQSYGLTESTGGVTVLRPEDHLPDPTLEQRQRSAGQPMVGARVKVVDPMTLEELPPGQRGEVIIGPERIMKGYWRKPEETARVMLPGGWLRTGDGGSFDEDGYLYLHDRLKDMIVSGGENIYPAEVESAMTAHPDLAEVAVIGVPSEKWGESPWAVVVPRPEATVDPDALIAWTRERLAHFKCPVGVSIVEALPRNATGKLLKHVLRDEHVAG